MKKIWLICLLLPSLLSAQELNCRVDVNFESLPVNNRELLTDFASVIQDYMNSTRFTDMNLDGAKIDCAMSIFFIGAGSDVDYNAQVVVTSQRPIYKSTNNSPMLTVNDAQWSFRYEKGQPLYSGQSTYDPITSFLDFYAMIIIGFDWDTWEEFGGTPHFTRAQDIVNLGANSNSAGWQSSSSPYNRWGLVHDLLNQKYSAFRSSIFDYHYGIDIYQVNKELGQQKIASLVNVLYDMYQKQGAFNSVLIRTFFDAKNGEIIDRLKGYEDMSVFQKLKKIDVTHSAKYDAVMP